MDLLVFKYFKGFKMWCEVESLWKMYVNIVRFIKEFIEIVCINCKYYYYK